MFNRLKKSLVTVFGISSVEANGIVMLFLILAAIIFSSVVWVRLKHDEYLSYQEDKKLLDSLLQMMTSDTARASVIGNFRPVKKEKILFRFNPNTASTAELDKLGIPPWIAERIVKYRNSGGRFLIRNDLTRIYGMPDEVYRELRPYIDLPDSLPRTMKDKKIIPVESVAVTKKISIDLNKADSTELTGIYGIGPVLASRIVKYRDLLGGFVSLQQLHEIYGLKEPVLSTLKEEAYIENSFTPRKIRINFAEWKDFVHHPYIDKYLANNIISARDKSGPFHSVEDLRKITYLNDSIISKISPYLTF